MEKLNTKKEKIVMILILIVMTAVRVLVNKNLGGAVQIQTHYLVPDAAEHAEMEY